MKTLVLGNLFKLTKAWFLLAHKHKDIRLHRLAYLTQFSIPTLLKPMISKRTDEGDVLLFALLVIYLFRFRRRQKVKKIRRPKRFYVREVYLHRQAQGDFHKLVLKLRGNDREHYFR